MPELPEVETMRRGILAAIGSRLVGIDQPKNKYRPIAISPTLQSMRKRLIGQSITDIRRLGKRVIIDFESNESLVLQPKMAGLIAINDVPSAQHTRMIFRLDGTSISQFCYWDRRGLGTIHLWTNDELVQKLNSKLLGPDALAIAFDDFYRTFQKVRKPIKPALLDQHRVAGVGNLYASEILHAAGVHPELSCDSLSKQRWQRVYDEMRRILFEAIQYEGSTLGDGTYRNALNQSGGYQNVHRVYDRSDEKCLSCANAIIVRIVQSQRSSFYCPKCQRLKRT
jgi:formamidopyrimidine-DNA glycosylase